MIKYMIFILSFFLIVMGGVLIEKKLNIEEYEMRISNPINWSERDFELRQQVESWLKDNKQPKLKDIVDLIITAEKKMVGDD